MGRSPSLGKKKKRASLDGKTIIPMLSALTINTATEEDRFLQTLTLSSVSLYSISLFVKIFYSDSIRRSGGSLLSTIIDCLQRRLWQSRNRYLKLLIASKSLVCALIES